MRARPFLAALAADRRLLDATPVHIVVAHPDDETIGCGAQLSRLRGVSVLVVTDGAPRNLQDAKAYGFESAAAYAEARNSELHTAMQRAGLEPGAIVRFGIPDQGCARSLSSLSRRLADHLAQAGTSLVITHAYEGGHPDHDATAFAVHAARRLLQRRGYELDIIEMPLYRASPEGTAWQSFAPPMNGTEVRIALDADLQAHKRELIDAYVTQRRTLAAFPPEVELFRCAEDYDFTVRPNGGRLLYESYDWGLTGEEWCALARRSLQELALEH